MELFVLLMLIAGAVCFALAAFGVPARISLVPLGLLFWILTLLVPALDRAL